MRGTISSNGLSTIRIDFIFGGLWVDFRALLYHVLEAQRTKLDAPPCQSLIINRVSSFRSNREGLDDLLTHCSNLHDIYTRRCWNVGFFNQDWDVL